MNPATSKSIGELHHASRGDLDQALAAADKATRLGARCPPTAAKSCIRPPIWFQPVLTKSPRY